MRDDENVDVIRQLADAPGWLRDAVQARPVAAPGDAAGAWGVGDVVGHVRAADAILSARIFHVLVREAPPLPAFDERLWGKLYAAAARPLAEQVEHYALRRVELVAVLRTLTPEQWLNGGRHELAGAQTVIDICRGLAGHESEHRAQLDGIIARGREA